jgi:hypothetical protein
MEMRKMNDDPLASSSTNTEDSRRARDFWEKTNSLRASTETAGETYAKSMRAIINAPDDDPVDHPAHYTSHPSGTECIEIVEHMNFNLGNAIKYIWRSGEKGDTVNDLKKARWYVDRELQRIAGKDA